MARYPWRQQQVVRQPHAVEPGCQVQPVRPPREAGELEVPQLEGLGGVGETRSLA
ncbi:MAG: hypothetical protein KA072_00290 [Thermoanaerobaculaceae bacterium]|nr:hypothetical protein [Thermoanaerobaculaceae bacterium]MDI9621310.1 hypothetical protein [Acidobacteriota bacterium]NLH09822.1 hypothetical protein [Holophagae bacterium]HPW54158.1 hypothetical protein [Thermoanaerobaculaceae bacterium]